MSFQGKGLKGHVLTSKKNYFQHWHMSVNPKNLHVDFVLPNFNLSSLTTTKADFFLKKKLNCNFTEEKDSSQLSNYYRRREWTGRDSRRFAKEKRGIPSTMITNFPCQALCCSCSVFFFKGRRKKDGTADLCFCFGGQ